MVRTHDLLTTVEGGTAHRVARRQEDQTCTRYEGLFDDFKHSGLIGTYHEFLQFDVIIAALQVEDSVLTISDITPSAFSVALLLRLDRMSSHLAKKSLREG